MSSTSEAMSEAQPFAGAYEQPFKVVEIADRGHGSGRSI